MSTIKDVARKAGVSTATVSHVVNRTRFVSQELQQRVWQAIEELGYRPNLFARALVTKRSGTLALLIDDILNPFFSEIALAAMQRAKQFGYRILVCNTRGNQEEKEGFFNSFHQGYVDGVISMIDVEEPLMQSLVADGVPLVLSGQTKQKSRLVRSIIVDFAKGAFEATQYLISLGHRRICFIPGPLTSTADREKLEGYKQALETSSIPFAADLVVESNAQLQGGYEVTLALLAREQPPTAIFTSSDLLALGALRAVLDKRMRVPEEISIAGYDDIEVSKYAELPLTTVHLPKYEIGSTAVDLMVKVLQGKRTNRSISFSPRLVIRRSTGPVESIG